MKFKINKKKYKNKPKEKLFPFKFKFKVSDFTLDKDNYLSLFFIIFFSLDLLCLSKFYCKKNFIIKNYEEEQW